jgi:hypothetical protein
MILIILLAKRILPKSCYQAIARMPLLRRLLQHHLQKQARYQLLNMTWSTHLKAATYLLLMITTLLATEQPGLTILLLRTTAPKAQDQLLLCPVPPSPTSRLLMMTNLVVAPQAPPKELLFYRTR